MKTPRVKRASGAGAAPRDGGLADLLRCAKDARTRALAPFSRFKVGAALRTRTGEIVSGCNIENATYGLTMCAERVAAFKAVSEGFTSFDAVAIVTESKRPAAPCGACRQILWELCGDILVHMKGPRGEVVTRRLSELLPLPFDRRNL